MSFGLKWLDDDDENPRFDVVAKVGLRLNRDLHGVRGPLERLFGVSAGSGELGGELMRFLRRIAMVTKC